MAGIVRRAAAHNPHLDAAGADLVIVRSRIEHRIGRHPDRAADPQSKLRVTKALRKITKLDVAELDFEDVREG